MHIVLRVPELLHNIFRLSATSSCSSGARVCRAWSNIALDRLWSDIELTFLLDLIVPASDERIVQPFDIITYIESAEWRRFLTYARRVRYLDVLHVPRNQALIMEHFANDQLPINRPLLPKLISLTITSYCKSHESLYALLYPGLQSFYVSLTELHVLRWQGYFMEIAERAPNITRLSTMMYKSIMDDLEGFESAFDHLHDFHDLEEFYIPEYMLTPSIVSILSTLPDLRIISFHDFEAEHVEARGQWPDFPFQPTLSENAFPSLEMISIPATLRDVEQFFQMRHAPRHITRLRIFGMEIDTLDSVLYFTEFLADTCPSLTEFALRVFSGDLSGEIGSQSENKLSFTELRPLLRLHGITTFECFNFCPLILTPADLIEMAQKWPLLELITLTPEPWIPNDPSLRLSDLSLVANRFPNLLHLGIYVDTRTSEDLPIVTQQFPKLTSISFGTSPISNHERVGPYILNLCPKLRFFIMAEDEFGCVGSTAMERGLPDFSAEYEQQWDGVCIWLRSRGIQSGICDIPIRN